MNFVYILSVLVSLLAVSFATDWIWFSKSLDYYTLKKCSPLEKSSLTGKFKTCLEKPKRDKRNLSWGYNFNDGANRKTVPATTKAPETEVTANDWPKSMCSDLVKFNDCFQTILDLKCLLENERTFFETTKHFFEAQQTFICENGDEIAKEFKNSSCKHKMSIDVNTQCFSKNHNKQNWFFWPLNYEDGVMCNYFNNLMNCELEAYEKCPTNISKFIHDYWEVAVNSTPCTLKDGEKGPFDSWSDWGKNNEEKRYIHKDSEYDQENSENYNSYQPENGRRNRNRDNNRNWNHDRNRNWNNGNHENHGNSRYGNHGSSQNGNHVNGQSGNRYNHRNQNNDYNYNQENNGYSDRYENIPRECRREEVEKCVLQVDYQNNGCGSTGNVVDCLNLKLTQCIRYFTEWEVNKYRGMKRTFETIHDSFCNRRKNPHYSGDQSDTGKRHNNNENSDYGKTNRNSEYIDYNKKYNDEQATISKSEDDFNGYIIPSTSTEDESSDESCFNVKQILTCLSRNEENREIIKKLFNLREMEA